MTITRLTKVIGAVQLNFYEGLGKKAKLHHSMPLSEMLGKTFIRKIARAVKMEMEK